MLPLEPSPKAPSWGQTLDPIVVQPSAAASATTDHLSPLADSLPQLSVLHLVNGEHFSGAERVQSHLGRCLPDYGVRADFVCLKPGRFAQVLREQNGSWGQCFEAPMANRFDLRCVWSIRKLILRQGYDVLHAHTPRTAMIASMASRLTGIPWVYHVHSPAARDSANPISNHLNALIEKVSLIGCRHLITVSESLRLDCMRRGTNESQVTVVHNGVPSICPPRQQTPQVGATWTIGMVALVRPRKGLEIVLDALAKLRDKVDVRLRIIGPFETTEYEETINDQIAELQISSLIERVGFTDDVPAELAKLDAMVLPSLFGEGLPMVVLEAMAAGLPVIATRVEGTPEAITDGVEGLLAEPRDADSLAAAIESLVDGTHDWEQMSAAAVERHARDFSDVAMARGTAAVYRNVAAAVRD
ncbi:glycosyltransferase family 4 protein [Roseiconus lacunae]|uniref:Glycosyltransferase family 4 protein n=1 Tax=Roseiconus lacunae TaxID=2605694 RepID=A0ABT7PQV2_9BACT|nr:glycosyltransferase family 4 protein [Roseiconus lacunae]MDM4018664.1 glycosyltransferase family 4 protein [Roseiconus lacunae]